MHRINNTFLNQIFSSVLTWSRLLAPFWYSRVCFVISQYINTRKHKSRFDSQCPSASLSLITSVCISLLNLCVTLGWLKQLICLSSSRGDECNWISRGKSHWSESRRVLMCEVHLPTLFYAPIGDISSIFSHGGIPSSTIWWTCFKVVKSLTQLMFSLSESLHVAVGGCVTDPAQFKGPGNKPFEL